MKSFPHEMCKECEEHFEPKEERHILEFKETVDGVDVEFEFNFCSKKCKQNFYVNWFVHTNG